MHEEPIKNEQLDNIIEFLSPISLFKNINRTVLADLISSMKIIRCEGGEVIVRKGDRDKDLYILYHGRLGVYDSQEKAGHLKETLINEVIPGQIIGEIGLLSNYQRINTIIAVRDCILLKLEQESFKKIETQYPAETLELAKQALNRIVNRPKEVQSRKTITLSIAPAGNSNHRTLVDILYHDLKRLKPTVLVNKEICNRYFDKDCSNLALTDPGHDAILQWLLSLEEKYEYIIYETDSEMTPWTERCLRQSDRIFFTVQENVSFVQNSIEIAVSKHPKKYSSPDYIFLHGHARISGSKKWLDHRSVQRYLHINYDSIKDRERLLRFINGTSFGVVLNGGGARGFAHLGPLKVLFEMGIPIDFIGSCSMGAFVASQYAKGLTFEEMKKVGVDTVGLYKSEFSLPLVSLMSANSVAEICKILGGDLDIEDLHYPFFCVSANLTQNKLDVLDRGLLWRALRSTISIPGVFPPMYNDEGDCLVDGGIINNMPVDLMQNFMGPGKILAINCSLPTTLSPRLITEASFSYWKYMIKKWNPFNAKRQMPHSIFNTLMTSMQLGSNHKQIQNAQLADYYLEIDTRQFTLFEYYRLQELIDKGYQDSREKLFRMFEANPPIH